MPCPNPDQVTINFVRELAENHASYLLARDDIEEFFRQFPSLEPQQGQISTGASLPPWNEIVALAETIEVSPNPQVQIYDTWE